MRARSFCAAASTDCRRGHSILCCPVRIRLGLTQRGRGERSRHAVDTGFRRGAPLVLERAFLLDGWYGERACSWQVDRPWGHRPRRRGRGVESEEVALERGRLDAVIAGLLFMAGMRRNEVSALCWADVVDTTDGDGMLITVRRSKTNQEGEMTDVRFVKDGVVRALRTLRAAPRVRSPVTAWCRCRPR